MEASQKAIAHHLQLYEQFYRGANGLTDIALAEPSAVEEFVTSWSAAWDAHDVDAITALCTEDVVWEDPFMFGQPARGREQIREFTEMLFASFPDASFTPVGPPYFTLEAQGIAQAWRGTGTFDGKRMPAWPPGSRGLSFAPTGRRFDVEGVDVYQFRDMRIRRWQIMYDPLELSRQLGLLPELRGRAARLLSWGQRATAALLRRRSGRHPVARTTRKGPRGYVPERKRNPFINSATGARILSAMMLPRFTLLPPAGFGVLTTTGRKTGKKRRKCIRAIRRGNKAYIVCIRYPTSWLHNIRANPNVRLRVRDGTFSGVARELGEGAERQQAMEAYCDTVNPFDYSECLNWRPGRPTRAKIKELHHAWFDQGIPLVVELGKEGADSEKSGVS